MNSQAALCVRGQNPLHQFPRSKSVISWRGKSPLCLLCCVVSQIPLQRLVADLLETCWPWQGGSFPVRARLQGSYGETCV